MAFKIIKEKSAELRKKRRKKLLMFFSILIVTATVLLGLIYYLSRLPQVVVQEIKIEGDSTELEEIDEFLRNELRGSYYFFVPKNNLFVVKASGIDELVLNKFPKLKNADVSFDGRNMDVKVSQKEPFGVWCNESIKCYFFGDDGFIFSPAPSYNGSIYKRFEGLLSGDDVIGKQYISFNEIQILKALFEILEHGGHPITETSIESQKSVKLHTVEGAVIVVDLTKKRDDVVDYLQVAMQSDVLKDKDFSSVEYIDARFGTKLFLKEKE